MFAYIYEYSPTEIFNEKIFFAWEVSILFSFIYSYCFLLFYNKYASF